MKLSNNIKLTKIHTADRLPMQQSLRVEFTEIGTQLDLMPIESIRSWRFAPSQLHFTWGSSLSSVANSMTPKQFDFAYDWFESAQINESVDFDQLLFNS